MNHARHPPSHPDRFSIGFGYLAYANGWRVAFRQPRVIYVFLYLLWNWEPPERSFR